MASASASEANLTMATDTKPTAVDSSKDVWISEQPTTMSNWYKQISWINMYFVIGIHIIGFTMAYSTPLVWRTALWAFAYYFVTGLGITAGYHRLWSHTSYTATPFLQYTLAILGAGSIQGSIRWWSRNHRAHHRYVDTAKDPYSAHLGFWYSHMGWLVFKQNPKRVGRVEVADLNNDKVIQWQHEYFVPVALWMALGLPTCVAGLGWGDWWGGLVYAGMVRLFVVQQATFCVNSLAHWLGDQPFDDKNTPRDHVVTAFATLGEGYHNFHHEFPSDYRNAIRWYQYDPTKWFIATCKVFGLASNLKKFPQNEIEKGIVQQQQKKLDTLRATLDWGIPLSQLPLISWDDYVLRCSNSRVSPEGVPMAGEKLILVAGVVHDVSAFVNQHPGGKILVNGLIGKDATSVFNGGVYEHSNAAHNLLGTMRVGVLRGGGEVEIWKRGWVEREVKEKGL